MGRRSTLPTPPQKKILVLLFEKECAGQTSPTYREIAAELGWRSTGTVRDHAGSLARKGFLSRSRAARGLRLTNAGRLEARGAVPKSSLVQEGAPAPSVEAKEAFSMLASYFRKRRIPAGTVLWHKGDPADLVVAIDEGRVRIYRTLPDGNIASIFMFGPGDLFGFLPFLDGRPYPATAMAVDDVRARTLSREGLLQAILERPEVVFPLFSYLGQRLRDAFDRIEILNGRGALPRVAAALVKLMPNDAAGGTTVLHLPMPAGEFARTLGITPESFSRVVTAMTEMGVIRRLGRCRYQILEPRSLQSIGSPSRL